MHMGECHQVPVVVVVKSKLLYTVFDGDVRTVTRYDMVEELAAHGTSVLHQRPLEQALKVEQVIARGTTGSTIAGMHTKADGTFTSAQTTGQRSTRLHAGRIRERTLGRKGAGTGDNGRARRPRDTGTDVSVTHG